MAQSSFLTKDGGRRDWTREDLPVVDGEDGPEIRFFEVAVLDPLSDIDGGGGPWVGVTEVAALSPLSGRKGEKIEAMAGKNRAFGNIGSHEGENGGKKDKEGDERIYSGV